MDGWMDEWISWWIQDRFLRVADVRTRHRTIGKRAYFSAFWLSPLPPHPTHTPYLRHEEADEEGHALHEQGLLVGRAEEEHPLEHLFLVMCVLCGVV